MYTINALDTNQRNMLMLVNFSSDASLSSFKIWRREKRNGFNFHAFLFLFLFFFYLDIAKKHCCWGWVFFGGGDFVLFLFLFCFLIWKTGSELKNNQTQ